MLQLDLFPPEIDQAWPRKDLRANLAIHLYQVACTAALAPQEYPLDPKDPDLFAWRYSLLPVSPLEALARRTYETMRQHLINHATIHVAVAGLAQLGWCAGEPPWDLADLNGYVVFG